VWWLGKVCRELFASQQWTLAQVVKSIGPTSVTAFSEQTLKKKVNCSDKLDSFLQKIHSDQDNIL
jgi:hypothetical protein